MRKNATIDLNKQFHTFIECNTYLSNQKMTISRCKWLGTRFKVYGQCGHYEEDDDDDNSQLTRGAIRKLVCRDGDTDPPRLHVLKVERDLPTVDNWPAWRIQLSDGDDCIFGWITNECLARAQIKHGAVLTLLRWEVRLHDYPFFDTTTATLLVLQVSDVTLGIRTIGDPELVAGVEAYRSPIVFFGGPEHVADALNTIVMPQFLNSRSSIYFAHDVDIAQDVDSFTTVNPRDVWKRLRQSAFRFDINLAKRAICFEGTSYCDARQNATVITLWSKPCMHDPNRVALIAVINLVFWHDRNIAPLASVMFTRHRLFSPGLCGCCDEDDWPKRQKITRVITYGLPFNISVNRLSAGEGQLFDHMRSALLRECDPKPTLCCIQEDNGFGKTSDVANGEDEDEDEETCRWRVCPNAQMRGLYFVPSFVPYPPVTAVRTVTRTEKMKRD